MRFIHSIVLFFGGLCSVMAQELIQNGGAEITTLWIGWVQADPAENWQWKSAANRPPHSGSYHFYPGDNTSVSGNNITELYQNIPLNAFSAEIDAGTSSYTFSGWRRGYKNASPFSNDLDQSRIVVEYRDAADNVLDFYDTGSAVFTSWTNNTDTRVAPVGTRSVRIRLISKRITPSDNDGYYDDISFIHNVPSCTPPTSITLTPSVATAFCLGSTLTISATTAPANANYYYTWFKNGVAQTTPSTTYTPFTRGATVSTDAGTYTLRVEDGNAGNSTCYLEKSVTITVTDPPVAGTISTDQEICLGSSASAFTGSASTGGVVVKNYKWQRSTISATGPWTTVQAYSTTATGYNPGAVSATTYYRRIDSSGACLAVPTNALKIRVNNKALLSPITTAVRDTLCVGENFQLTGHVNTTTQPSLNGGYYYSWRKVQGTTSTIVAVPSATLTPYPTTVKSTVLADSGTYYLIVQDGAGASLCKDSVKISIHINQGPSVKGLIQSHQEICLNTAASILTEISPGTGSAGGPLSYQWYRTKDTTGAPTLTKITGAQASSYNPGTPVTSNYFVRKDSIKYCAAVATNFLQVRVNNTPILDSIRATVNDTLCENFGDQFQLKGYVDSITAGKASVNGGYYFTWKKLQQPATVATVVGTPGKYADYPAVSRAVTEADSGTYYLIVQDGSNAKKCLDSISLKIVVIKTCIAISCVKPTSVSIKAASNTQLCAGKTLVLQKDVITFPATPPVFGYTYSWIRTNASGTVVVQAPSTTYQDYTVNAVTVADSGRYQLIVRDGTNTPAICAEISPSISIVILNAVTPAQIGRDTIICPGKPVNPFIELTANTGGTGIYTYQWQSSLNNIAFTSIAGATNASYQSPVISIPTYFRRLDQSGDCAAVYTDTILVSISAGMSPGIINSSNPTICPGTIPAQPIVSSAPASGGTGGSSSLTYQWQRSPDNLIWSDIAGATAISYTETLALTDTMYYRRRAGMGPGSCDTTFTSPVAINVYAPFTPGTIGNDQSVCAGTSVTLVELTAASGGGAANTQTYQWFASADNGGTWQNAAGNSTSKNYNSGILSDTMLYKRLAMSSCKEDTSNIVKINIDTLSHPHVFLSNGVTCQSTDLVLTATANNSGTTPTYIWQKAGSVSGPWTTIAGATTVSYLISNPQPADSGTVYKVIVTSSDACNAGPDDETVILEVHKNTQPKVNITSSVTGPACDIIPSVTYTAVPVQGQGSAPTYQWYDGTTNTAITGATSISYTPSGAPVNGSSVYVIMSSSLPCATLPTATSAAYVLHLLPTPNPILVALDTTICTPGKALLKAIHTQTSGTTFSWYKDGVLIPGATGTTYEVKSQDIPGGVYTFKEANAGCEANAMDIAKVTIVKTPLVSAGSDMQAHKNGVVTLQGTVSNAGSFVWKPAGGLSNPNILNPDATITNTVVYTLYATDPTGTCSAESNVTITIGSPITIPNVITPNGDGVNDTWNIEHIEEFPDATFVIYNRWGNIVWKATGNSFQWNGTNYRNGEVLPEGTYFYILDLHSRTFDEPYTGYIQIVK
jgi:gliding motility-associated-like protein